MRQSMWNSPADGPLLRRMRKPVEAQHRNTEINRQNGHPAPRGTVWFCRDSKTSSDRSAKYVGSPWAVAAAAVVQADHQGTDSACAVVLPAGLPISSISAEPRAVLLCMIGIRESQRKGNNLIRYVRHGEVVW